MKMNVTRDEPDFKPINIEITLENRGDLDIFRDLLVTAELASARLLTKNLSGELQQTLEKELYK